MNVLGAVCGIAIASTSLAVAQPASTIALEYVAPAACPDEISLRAGVVARLGRDPFFGDAPRKAFVDVQPTAAGFVAAIELREHGRPPSRRVVGPTAKCEDALGALELALAVIVDPSYGDAPAPRPPPPRPQPQAQPPRGYEPPGWRGLPPPNAPRPPPTAEIAIGGGGITGTLPGTGSGIVFRAGYLQPAFRIGIVARMGSTSASYADDLNANLDVAQVLAEGCFRRWLVVACGGAGISVTSVVLYDYSLSGSERGTDYSETALLLALSTGLDVPIGRAFFRPTLEIGVPYPATAVVSQNVTYREAPAGQLAFDLVLGYRW